MLYTYTDSDGVLHLRCVPNCCGCCCVPAQIEVMFSYDLDGEFYELRDLAVKTEGHPREAMAFVVEALAAGSGYPPPNGWLKVKSPRPHARYPPPQLTFTDVVDADVADPVTRKVA